MHPKHWHLLVAASCLGGCTPHEDLDRAITIGDVLSNPSAQGFTPTDQVIQFEFPRDHGQHTDFQNEWWYLTSVLETSVGREFGAQFTIFRHGYAVPDEKSVGWRSKQAYMAHFAISDVELEQHTAFERLVRGHPQQAHVVLNPFRAYVDNWEIRKSDEAGIDWQLSVQSAEYGLQLTLGHTKPPVLHGRSGLSRKSHTNFSYYYSLPRIETHGQLRTPEGTFAVTGISWFDHEWMSQVLSRMHSGWDWFALQFDDSTEIVVFQLRTETAENNEKGVAVMVNPDGTHHELRDDKWHLVPKETWNEWPTEWELRVSDRIFHIKPPFEDQLMDTYFQYWEGLVHVTENDQIVGRGYMELTGY